MEPLNGENFFFYHKFDEKALNLQKNIQMFLRNCYFIRTSNSVVTHHLTEGTGSPRTLTWKVTVSPSLVSMYLVIVLTNSGALFTSTF